MLYPWDDFSLPRFDLKDGPQEVQIGDANYTCYVRTPDRRFIGTCATDMTVYELHPGRRQVTALALDTAPFIAEPQWQVTTEDMCVRAAQMASLDEVDVQAAIATHFVTGLAMPPKLAEELVALLVERLPAETELAQQLARYRADTAESPQLANCAAAVVLLARRLKT